MWHDVCLAEATGSYPEAMTTPGQNVEMVNIPRAELDAMRAELRLFRLAAARAEALRRIKAFSPENGGPLYTGEELAEAWGIGLE
jgi:hypothetical protein